ncbi:hypothetical protein C0Q70_19887 [Pomacea canaliculata]|uniref:Uncharacterized protein n=1 Tax=Pomacea canaliculata TaxID=400727 RepID=A0A2T7NE07_POMCA|nr:hypothetical protein C0Q70_19887 [Pomacea canaliculata]
MCSHANGVRPATLNLSTEMHPGSDGDSGGGSASSGESLPHDGVVPMLAYALSKEIALFCNLSMGLGGVSDSDRLRDELRQSRDRACALAHENKIILLPLLKSTRKSSDTRGELERLYRLYSACLEFFEIQLLKVRSLLALFPLHTETCLFINTGIADPLSILSRATTCASKDSPFRRRRSSDDQKFVTKEKDELERIKKEAANIQEILYNVSSTVDIPPWEIIETTKQSEEIT